MPRQLPWAVKKKPTEAARATSSPASTTDHAPKSVDRSNTPVSATPRAAQGARPTGEATRRNLITRPDRSPSTSPPPQRVEEEFMIEGVDHDDKFRMVEDEFVSMAGEFTKHLHAAEYQRLKALAKSQNADTIRSISRPVTGEITDLVRRRQKALSLAVSQRKAIKKDLARRGMAADSDGEEPWAGTSLQGLMDSPRKAMRLTTMTSSIAGTRASAGDRTGLSTSKGLGQLTRRPALDLSTRNKGSSDRWATFQAGSSTGSEDEGEDDGDLDGPSIPLPNFKARTFDGPSQAQTPRMTTEKFSRLSTFTKVPPKSSPAPSKQHSGQRPFSTPTSELSGQMVPTPTPSRSGPDKKPVDLTGDDNDDEDDFFARRRNQRDQKRKRIEQPVRPSGLDDIPFM